MATEYGVQTETRSLIKIETDSPYDDPLECLLLDDFERPDYDLLDFDPLLESPVGKEEKIECGGYEDSDLDCGYARKRKLSHEEDASFLNLLDDIFVHDKSLEMVNCPLERIEELLQYRLAGSPEKKRRKVTNGDESFATPKIYTCHYCPKKFYSSVLCHHHQVRHTKVLLRCPWCGHRSRSNSGLRRHIQYFHQYSSMCQVFFDSR